MAALLFKIVLLLILGAILLSLSSGMVFLVKDQGRTDRTRNALTIRIVLSLLLFVMLFIGYRLGWIQPHGISTEQKADSIPSERPKG
ncbi:MAG: twin transmembrane helix small protein [Candidatus Eutrophobiaceae bacterium]